MGKEEDCAACGADPESGIDQARLGLLEAKEAFVEASQAIDPLAFVRERPFLSAGGAFLLGFGLTSLSKQLLLAQSIPLLLQTAETASRIIMNFRRN